MIIKSRSFSSISLSFVSKHLNLCYLRRSLGRSEARQSFLCCGCFVDFFKEKSGEDGANGHYAEIHHWNWILQLCDDRSTNGDVVRHKIDDSENGSDILCWKQSGDGNIADVEAHRASDPAHTNACGNYDWIRSALVEQI